MNKLINFLLTKVLYKFSKTSIVFIISLLPILELRGGLIVAKLLEVPYLKALPICILGNILPIPFILLFINKIILLLENLNLTKNIALFLKNKIEKHKSQIEKYGYIGLILFVGIPLPGTGAWTGALIAASLKMDFKKSIICIFIGILVASIIMSFLSYVLLNKLLFNI